MIADLGTRRLTWRRLGVLLKHLPRESAYVQAVAGPAARWGDTEHLLAGVIDVIQIGNYLTQRAHFKGNVAPPRRLRRPGDEPDQPEGRYGGRRSYTREQMRTMLDNWGSDIVDAVEVKEVT